MVGRLAFTAAMVLAGSVMAGPKEDLEAGVRKLAGTSYAWKSVVERRRGEAPRAMVTLTREGKIDETGTMRMTETRSGVTGSTVASVEAVLKGRRALSRRRTGGSRSRRSPPAASRVASGSPSVARPAR